MSFGENFIWGAATSSYQIEGAAFEDGRGLSIWDDFCSIPGKIFGGHRGDIACDHYHCYSDDVDIMSELGINAYRFSTAWPRILPSGFGEINSKGLDFYDKLVDALLEKDIVPYVTLFHWDLPYELFKHGGWLNPDSPKWFADYAEIVAKKLGDRAKCFITFNEPQCFIGLGYVTGAHAPGNIMSKRSNLQMAHNVMLAHGYAVQAIRSVVSNSKIGYAPTSSVAYPVSNSPEDIDAARNAYFSIQTNPHNYLWNVTWWSDPVLLGKYPEEGIKLFGPDLPVIGQDDMDIISQPLDFYGQNIYNGFAIKAGIDGACEYAERVKGYSKTSIGWPVTPECLYWGPKFLFERYGLPIYITENGMACHDTVSVDGKVHDPNRIDFLHRYISELKRAIEDGVDISGYFIWSLLDNFEWTNGYSERFGLVYVDYKNKKRIIKDSGYWYQKLIKTNGEIL
ncbi:MAG: GH1 family beta-glucosidase [Xylanivirga thermophila]|jgi:beta-glucosidase|uniref:GH1 family beta-glucosidase n=1 Tax=Xylanivirga thermophila TaxID=2496273 RepID=UPI0039F48534